MIEVGHKQQGLKSDTGRLSECTSPRSLEWVIRRGTNWMVGEQSAE
jgi:hypothetical protein